MVGVSILMLRNLGILNILLCWPTRFDQYNAGPCDVKRMARATKQQGTKKITDRIIAATTSNIFFICISYVALVMLNSFL